MLAFPPRSPREGLGLNVEPYAQETTILLMKIHDEHRPSIDNYSIDLRSRATVCKATNNFLSWILNVPPTYNRKCFVVVRFKEKVPAYRWHIVWF